VDPTGPVFLTVDGWRTRADWEGVAATGADVLGVGTGAVGVAVETGLVARP